MLYLKMDISGVTSLFSLWMTILKIFSCHQLAARILKDVARDGPEQVAECIMHVHRVAHLSLTPHDNGSSNFFFSFCRHGRNRHVQEPKKAVNLFIYEFQC